MKTIPKKMLSHAEADIQLRTYQRNNSHTTELEQWVSENSIPFQILYRGAAIHRDNIIDGVYDRKGLSSWTFNKQVAYEFVDHYGLHVGGDYVPAVFTLLDGYGLALEDQLIKNLYPNEEEVVISDNHFEIIDVMAFEGDDDFCYELIVKPIRMGRKGHNL